MTTTDPTLDDALLERAPDAATAELALVGLLAAAVETAGVAAAATAIIPYATAAALLLHLAVCGGLALWVRSRLRRELDVRLAGLMLVTTPVLGPLGPLFTLATAALHALFRRYATGFQDWYFSLFPENEVEPARELYELIVSGRETSHLAAGESFTDVMSVGSPQQKQAVIALVARHFRPAFTPALKAGLADADPSVRVQAATATARVEHEFNERWLTLDHAARSHPEDTDTVAALARHLDDYAFCGLLDANREAEIREKALAGYRHCLGLSPGDDDIRHDLGRLLMRCGLPAEAAERLAPLADRTTDPRILFWYAESLFRLGRYTDLRALAESRADLLGEAAALPDSLRDVFALWRSEPAPAVQPAMRGPAMSEGT